MTMTDEQLLAKAQKLDPEALRTLHQRFYQPVTRYIQFKVGDPQTVEDLSSEVFVRMVEGLKRGHGWKDSPQSWIMGIARNLVVDFYRNREKMPQVALNEQLPSSDSTDPHQYAVRSERIEHLKRALSQLTDEQRDVILLRFMEGVDIKGVAQAIDKTPGAIKGLQFRALRALADIMGDTSAESTVSVKK